MLMGFSTEACASGIGSHTDSEHQVVIACEQFGTEHDANPLAATLGAGNYRAATLGAGNYRAASAKVQVLHHGRT